MPPLSAGARATLGRLKGKRVAVLKGGWSRERSVSLRTGAAVEAALRKLGVSVLSVDVDRNVLLRLSRLRPDLAFIALHGAFGEDGRVQSGLEILGIPYTGSGPTASALAMDKAASKRLFEHAGVPTPAWALVDKADRSAGLDRAARLLRGGAVFVKPYDQGSAIGASRADTRAALSRAVDACLKISSCALVERFISGRELTVGILGPTALPVVEIVPEHAFYDYHSKYAKGGSRHLVPAPLPAAAARRAQKLALAAYRSLGCSAYARVDVLLDKRGNPWVLEVNTIPGMTATSLLPDAARAAGFSFEELVLEIIRHSLRERTKA
jgi:D-alanine-D-alanine ligase